MRLEKREICDVMKEKNKRKKRKGEKGKEKGGKGKGMKVEKRKKYLVFRI